MGEDAQLELSVAPSTVTADHRLNGWLETSETAMESAMESPFPQRPLLLRMKPLHMETPVLLLSLLFQLLLLLLQLLLPMLLQLLLPTMLPQLLLLMPLLPK